MERTHRRPATARHWVAGVLAATLSAALSGCALFANSPQEAYGGTASGGPLKGVSVTIGSKNFTEQLVLCEILGQRLEAMSAKVSRTCGMAGSSTVRGALTSGNIDAYWEYTGTGWITHLKQTQVIRDAHQQFAAVAEKDAANGITWLPPAPANNTYAIAASSDYATQQKVATISDYAALVTRDPKAASFCGAAEFLGRDDGWSGVSKAYGFALPRDSVATLAEGPIYQGIANGNPCHFGEVFATDGRVKALKLKVLADDKAFFPFYNLSLNVRTSVLQEHPAIGGVMAPVSALLTDSTMQELNASVDVDGKSPEEVARTWLRGYGLA